MAVKKADTLGMVRVRFKAIQREAVLRELHSAHDGHIDAMQTYVLHYDKYGEDDLRLTKAKIAVVDRALNLAEGTEPGRPFILTVPIWLAQSLTDNGTRVAIEALADTIDALTEGTMPDGRELQDPRAAIRRALKETRIWTKGFLAAHEFPRQPLS